MKQWVEDVSEEGCFSFSNSILSSCDIVFGQNIIKLKTQNCLKDIQYCKTLKKPVSYDERKVNSKIQK